MILVTLRDGTRRQIAASDVDQVEPMPSGSMIYLVSGDALEVQQDFRTIAARVSAILAAKIAEDVPPSEPAMEAEEGPVPAADTVTAPPMRTLGQRAKRMLRGRISLPAFIIGRGRQR
jgi:hypothetical protein